MRRIMASILGKDKGMVRDPPGEDAEIFLRHINYPVGQYPDYSRHCSHRTNLGDYGYEEHHAPLSRYAREEDKSRCHAPQKEDESRVV